MVPGRARPQKFLSTSCRARPAEPREVGIDREVQSLRHNQCWQFFGTDTLVGLLSFLDSSVAASFIFPPITAVAWRFRQRRMSCVREIERSTVAVWGTPHRDGGIQCSDVTGGDGVDLDRSYHLKLRHLYLRDHQVVPGVGSALGIGGSVVDHLAGMTSDGEAVECYMWEEGCIFTSKGRSPEAEMIRFFRFVLMASLAAVCVAPPLSSHSVVAAPTDRSTPPCSAPDLRMSARLQGVMGSVVGKIVLRNEGKGDCILAGFPRVALTGPAATVPRRSRWVSRGEHGVDARPGL